jgi:hypothetical protein
VEVRALTAADATTIARWRYPGPYATYDVDDDELGGRRFRLYILAWNGRSRAVAERLGFEHDGVLENDDGRFAVMTRDGGRRMPDRSSASHGLRS